jgi:type IV fimbrial biogenesis protein FimT
MTMPLVYQQMAAREIDTIARRFIAHAQFARGQALALGATVRITPLKDNLWDEGWVVKSACEEIKLRPACWDRVWLFQGDIYPVYFKGGGKQFIDPILRREVLPLMLLEPPKQPKVVLLLTV